MEKYNFQGHIVNGQKFPEQPPTSNPQGIKVYTFVNQKSQTRYKWDKKKYTDKKTRNILSSID